MLQWPVTAGRASTAWTARAVTRVLSGGALCRLNGDENFLNNSKTWETEKIKICLLVWLHSHNSRFSYLFFSLIRLKLTALQSSEKSLDSL